MTLYVILEGREKMKLFAVVTALIFTASLALAQTNSVSEKMDQPNLTNNSNVSRIIPQVSFIDSNFTGSDFKFDSKVGFSAGVAADIGTSNLVAESGILYRQLGTQTSQYGNNLVLNLGYIGLPLMAKVYTSTARHSAAAYFKGGIIPQILIYKNISGSQPGGDFPINSLDLEAAVGLGGRFPISQNNDFVLEATLNRGVTNVGASSSGGADVFNAALLVTAGIGINL
jgi:hypothetical protein